MDRFGRLMGGKYTSRSLGTAFLAAVSHLLPIQDPFAAPSEAAAAGWTDFGGQKGLSVSGCHPITWQETGPPWPWCGIRKFPGADLESRDAGPNPPKCPWAGYKKPGLPSRCRRPLG